MGDGVLDMKFVKGASVITQGDAADNFYFVADGTLSATRSDKPGDYPREVCKYQVGDYFGEVGLVHNIPR